jgi:undecaprenyl-diphosphatase
MTLPNTPPGPAESERLLSASLILGLLAAAAALALFSWIGREILAGVNPVLDDRIRLAVHGVASARLTAIMRGLSTYGGPISLTVLGIVLALAFLRHGWHRGALLLVLTLVGAALLNFLLKYLFARPRPAAFFDYPLPTSNSFPSGHAFFAASFFGGLAVLSADRIRSRPLRVAIWCVSAVLVALIGISRVYLGVHYPSDVLAGYAAATVWVASIALGDRLVSHRRRRRKV